MAKSLIDNRKCALYLRISRDENGEHRHSIETQKTLLDKYCYENKFEIYDYYIDKGISGTTFNRPNLKRMLEDIKYKRINTVIVKDLSRLGRNHLEVGNLLEKEFVGKIRFISISERIDTAYDYDDTIPLRNLVNEYYSKDLSKKVKSGLKAKGKNKRISSIQGGLYGYKYKEGTFELVIDPKPASIIKMIFEMYLEGNTTSEIVNAINKLQVPTPGFLRYLYYNDKSGYRENVGSKYIWTSTMIRRILKTYEYTGNTIQFKTTIINKRTVNVPKGYQNILKNSHPTIIDEKIFNQVQASWKPVIYDKRPVKEKNKTLQGFVVNDTNKSMTYVKRNGKGEYRSRLGNRYGISEDDLHYIVLEEFKSFITLVIENEEEAFNSLLNSKHLNYSEQKLKELLSLEKQINSEGSLLFTKKLMKEIDESLYKAQMKEINDKLIKLQSEIKHLEENRINKENFNKSFAIFKELVITSITDNLIEFAREVINKIQVIKHDNNEYKINISYKVIG